MGVTRIRGDLNRDVLLGCSFSAASPALGGLPSLESSEELLCSYSFLLQRSGAGERRSTVGPVMAPSPGLPACWFPTEATEETLVPTNLFSKKRVSFGSLGVGGGQNQWP